MVSYFFVVDRGRSFNSRKLSHFIKIEEKEFGACPWLGSTRNQLLLIQGLVIRGSKQIYKRAQLLRVYWMED